MSIRLDRVRGSRRKKIEQGVLDAGYIFQYSSNSYLENLRINKSQRVDIARLADNMKIDRKSMSKNFNDRNGIRLDLAKDIINFLHVNHDINLNLKFSDYNA